MDTTRALNPLGVGGGGGAPGPPGPPGVNAFTTTTANYVQPAVAATVVVSVADSTWIAIGQVLYVTGGGYYLVTATPSAVSVTLQNLGYAGNAAPAAVVASPADVSPGGLEGPAGTPGTAGLDAFTTSTANYVQPNVGADVTIDVVDSSWMATGQVVYVTGGGYYLVIATPTAITATLRNLGYSGNAAPAAVVASPADVSPGGLEGPAGTPGTPGAAGVNAFTTTTADYVQPAAGATVVVSVADSTWMGIGQILYVVTGGYYQVTATPTAITATLKNLAYNGNAAPATNIVAPQKVSPAGLAGQSIIVANIVDLAALDAGALGLVTGASVYVIAVQDTFVITTTALASDASATGPFRIITGTNMPVGTKWARRGDTNEVWKRQTAWFVSAATGSDLNVGSTSITAVKTVDEIWLRTGGVFPNNATITVVDGDMTLAGPFHIASASVASRNRMNITGTPTVIRTGSIVAVTARSGNTMASVQGSGQLDDGYIIRMTSGAQNGKVAPILENTGSVDTVNIPDSIFTSEAGGNSGTPAPGDTYELLNPSQQIALAFGTNIEITCKYFRLPSRPQGSNIALNCCRIDTLDASQTASCVAFIASSVIGSNGVTVECGSLSMWKFQSCSFRCVVRITDGASCKMLSTVHKDTTAARAIVEVGSAADAVTSFSTAASAEFNGLGVSGSPVCAVRIGPLGTVKNNGALYGASNTGNGVEVNFGGRMIVDNAAADPTITATVNEILVDGATSHITPLIGGSLVSSPGAATTWANWIANFSRRLLAYNSGSALLKAA